MLWTEGHIHEFPQEGFHGRQKMYGPLDPAKGDLDNPAQIVEDYLRRVMEATK